MATQPQNPIPSGGSDEHRFEQEAAATPAVVSDPAGSNGAVGAGAPVEEPPGGWTLAAVGMYVRFPFNYLAARLGDHWALTDDEAAALAPITCSLLNKWLPVGKWGEEIALALILLGIVLPRVAEQQKLNAAKAKSNTGTARSTASSESSASAVPENPGAWPEQYPPAAA